MSNSVVWDSSSRTVVPAGDTRVRFDIPAVLFGETLFETLRARRGKLFRPDYHLDRLHGSVMALQWGTPLQDEVVYDGLRAVLQDVWGTGSRSTATDVRLRITAVRTDESGALQYFITARPYAPPPGEMYGTGVDAVVTSLRVPASAPWLNHKTGQRLPFRMAKAEADRAGAWEGLLLNTDGMLAEGAIANVHFVVNGRVCTPSRRCGALPGIVRRILKEIAKKEGVPWESGQYGLGVLKGAEEAFLTNSLIGVLPLVRVDGTPIGAGVPGPMTRKLMGLYEESVIAESRRLF